jgi:DNA-binding NtrC family response regulator
LPVLLVDDEESITFAYKLSLQRAGFEQVLVEHDSRRVLPILEEQEVAVIVLDLFMPHISGIELLKEIHMKFPHIPVIVMTGAGEVGTAVDCMKSGAFDYLTKPADKTRLLSSIRKAMEMRELRDELSTLKEYLLTDLLEHESAFKSIVTKDKKMRAIFQYVEAIAQSPQPVLVAGDTGTGKELIAKTIHDVSGRSGKFVAVNVAGLDDTMFSDTLFGHEKGAYSGAVRNRAGLIQKASGGTLFLDEIGDLSELSQVKLLRLLQEGSYYQLGADLPKSSDARVVVATNKELSREVSKGGFRKDLYYRLNSHVVQLPPLRERIEDVPLLLNHFLKKAAKILKKKKPTPPPELITLLSSYNFPGNVREFEAMVFDAVTRHKSGVLSTATFRDIIRKEHSNFNSNAAIKTAQSDMKLDMDGRLITLKEAEKCLIDCAMQRSENNQRIAAEMLGITRQALNKRLLRKKEISA